MSDRAYPRPGVVWSSAFVSDERLDPPRMTICSRAAANARAIICISSRSCSTDSRERRWRSRSSCSSRCKPFSVGPDAARLAAWAIESPLHRGGG
eukprot:scaffold23360_cov137-Isochrysis_galbana.AAC.2